MQKSVSGVGVALVTPFNENLSIDYDGLTRLVEHVISGGVDFLVIMGTTGESATLSKDEKKAVLKHIKQVNAGRVPIIYGHGGNNTQELIEGLTEIDTDGVTALLSVCPYYNKPSQRGVIAHYKALADASKLPIILYNVPGRTGINLLSSTTLTLAEHPNIIGIKESIPVIDQTVEICAEKPEDFFVTSGDDLMTLSMMVLGANGVISVLANAYPTIFSEMLSSFEKGDLKRARENQCSLAQIHPLMYQEGNPAGIKHILSKMGICNPFVRLPLATVSDQLAKKIEEAMI